MNSRAWWIEMTMNESQDEDYRADVREEREAAPIKETCPNPSCYGGDVIVPCGHGLNARAVCGVCCGKGFIWTERR